MIHTTKLYPTQDATSFHVLGRIMSGTLLANQEVRILGENYSLQDEEDSRFGQVGRLWISEARYWVKIKFIDVVCSAFKTVKKPYFLRPPTCILNSILNFIPSQG